MINAVGDGSSNPRVGIEPAFITTEGSRYCSLWKTLNSTAQNYKGRITGIFELPDGVITNATQVYCYVQGLASGTAKIGRAKLEIGETATPWTPCPDDPASSVKTSGITIQDNSIDISSTGDITINAGGSLNVAASDIHISSSNTLGDKLTSIDGNIGGLTASVGSVQSGLATEITQRENAINLVAKQLNANPNLLVSTDMTQYPYNNALIWEAPTEWVECYDTAYTIGYQLYNGGYLYALSYDAIERLQGIEEKYMLANWQTGAGHSVEMQLSITNKPNVVYFWVSSNDQNRYVAIYATHNGEVPQEQRDQGYHSKIRIKNLKLYCLNSGGDIVYPYKATGFYQNMPPNFGAGYTTMYEFKENGTYTFSIGKVKNASVSDSSEFGCVVSLWNMSGYSQGDHAFVVSDEKQSFTFTLSNAHTHDVRLFYMQVIDKVKDTRLRLKI